jgi:hypothetical protein
MSCHADIAPGVVLPPMSTTNEGAMRLVQGFFFGEGWGKMQPKSSYLKKCFFV